MLKNIRLHLSKDEQVQHQIDEEFAASILETQRNNLNSFTRHIPSIVPILDKTDLDTHSLICNKYGEANIVDYGLGRTLYGFHPKSEVKQQVDFFYAHSPYIALDFNNEHSKTHDEIDDAKTISQSKGYSTLKSYSPAPEDIECMVILGIGLGHHILDLIQQKTIKYLIIYEPQLQYFKCSSLAVKWVEILSLAKQKGTQLFLQVGKDGRDLAADINELKAHANITGFYLYKHYNHSVFNSLYNELTNKTWAFLEQQGVSFKMTESFNEYAPPWTPPDSLKSLTRQERRCAIVQKNLEALKQYFPAIYQEFKDYQPKNWVPATVLNGETNLVKKDSLIPWYGDTPRNDCNVNFDNYNEQPNKDGLILGYSGNKLAHYNHYQFVKETEELLKNAEEEVGSLPEKIESIIMFGIGVGYQIEKLLEEHSVEKLFLCEPNTDFFYASLFAIDWMNIFEQIKDSDARIYLNIGDDGTNLFRDLLAQFYSIGPYILSNTYFYQSYYNASLNSAIAQLREQLQVVISMGEYFDHAYYGIEHTREGMRRNIPILTANPAEKLSYDDKEVPIFIIGNGPSLDDSISAIKEWQHQAIIVSCGTALQALHRHGITPDFHAEIEQNRSTFDWAVLVGDLDYLKNITLISCNGIHPDTCELYKDVLIAFKEGESSTVSALNILGSENYQVLQNAFPTVSNFSCDLFSQLGFSTIYLIGVDLGFVSVKHHHSKSSGYYQEDGQEIYDYAEKNNTSLVVPGNFRPTVNTKQEFKVSRQVIEQVTAHKPKNQSFYNCSDGARINGTLPIRPGDLLIVVTREQKQNVLEKLKTQIFSTDKLDNYIERFEKQFSHELLTSELKKLRTLVSQDITTKKQANTLINKQKEILFDSYKTGRSLLFYYLYGTVNYTNAVFTKLMITEIQPNVIQSPFIKAKETWLKTLKKLEKITIPDIEHDFDSSGYHVYIRELRTLEKQNKNNKLLIVSDSDEFRNLAMHVFTREYSWLERPDILTSREYLALKRVPDFLIIESQHPEIQRQAKENTLVVIKSAANKNLLDEKISQLIVPKMDNKHLILNSYNIVSAAFRSCLSYEKSLFTFPKIEFHSKAKRNDKSIQLPIDNYYVIRFPHYVCVNPVVDSEPNLQFSANGSRGRMSQETMNMEHLHYGTLSPDAFKEKLQIVSDMLRHNW